MPKYEVIFEGYRIIEAENLEEADLKASYLTLSDLNCDMFEIIEIPEDVV